MGNSDSKEASATLENNADNDKTISPDFRLKKAFESVCRRINKDGLDRADFKDHVMKRVPCESWHLFEYLCNGVCDRGKAELIENDFVHNGRAVVQLNDFDAQNKFYFDLFTKYTDKLKPNDLAEIVSASFICACRLSDIDDQTLVDITPCSHSIYKSMFRTEESVEYQLFNSWVQRNLSRLVHTLHQFTSHNLLFINPSDNQDFPSESLSTAASNTSPTDAAGSLVSLLTEGRYLLTLPYAWLLSSHLPLSYFPLPDDMTTENTVFLSSIVGGGWTSLYNSEEQGLSVNRLQHHVFAYEAPTVTMLSFEGHSYCITCTSPWREDKSQWGGSDCFLIQLSPEYKVMQSGTNLLFLNFKNRDLPKGLQIGSDHRSRFLQIDGDFHKVKLYGVDYPLHRLEVWGCGGEPHLKKQKQQRDWEKKDAQKQRDRKLKLEDWEDNPDRMLLNMGGVTTAHAEQQGDKS